MSKPEIKEYLESIYNVSVKSVNTKVGALLSCLARAQPLFLLLALAKRLSSARQTAKKGLAQWRELDRI